MSHGFGNGGDHGNRNANRVLFGLLADDMLKNDRLEEREKPEFTTEMRFAFYRNGASKKHTAGIH